jgi:hypothetical protein
VSTGTSVRRARRTFRPASAGVDTQWHQTGRSQFFKIGYSSLPGSHEADLPVELFLGAQPGDIARALGGVLPGDRVDVVLTDRAACRVIAKTWAASPPSVPFLARALDYDSRDPGMLRLLDNLYLSTDSPNASYTLKTIDALRSWLNKVGDLSFFTSSTTELLTGRAMRTGTPRLSWRQSDDEIEIEIEIEVNCTAIDSDAVVLISTDTRMSIVGPVTLVEEDGVCHSSVAWPPGATVEQVDLIVQLHEPGGRQP